MELVKWEKIRYEIENAKDIQELSILTDKLKAYKILAEQTKQSSEVQVKITNYLYRAKRKQGEWLAENIKVGNPEKLNCNNIVQLKDLEITRNESSRLQKIANIPDEIFEDILIMAEKEVKKVTDNILLRINKEIENEKNYNELKNRKIFEMPKDEFNIIYADPPWQYNNTGFEMSAENKYPTMSIEELSDLQFKTSKNAVLFLWVTNPLLKEAFDLIKTWGFEYKTNFVWCKKNHTAGFYIFGQHELLLICIKGSNMLPIEKYKSIIQGENKIHSKKPEIVYEMIEKMYPNFKYLELFARNKRHGWTSYGNEI